MSRTNGVYSLPAGSSFTPNTTIESSKVNAMTADIEADLNVARPILAGGTGATTAVGANDGLNTTSSNIASASTTDLSTMTGVVGTVTGTTTITAFGTVASGPERVLIFAGILILTHNATSLILPGAANITTAAGDVATFRSKGAGNWVCVDYQKAANSPGNLVSPVLVTPSITTSATITATNDGATGALLTTQHISASPAASDVIADLIVQGKDSAGNTDTYGNIQHIITDPTTTSEDSVWAFLTRVAGTLAERFRVGAGLYMTGATGGDKGAGTVNATAVYANGARVGGAPDAVLEDQKAAGTVGGNFVSGAWRTRDLNTEVRDPSGLVSISSNQFTPTVDGWVEWAAPVYSVDTHKTRLFNVTDTTAAGVGSTSLSGSGNPGWSTGGAPVVAGKAYQLEHQCTGSGGTSGFGSPSGFSSVEVYTRVMFWRTA